jgi:hypothetical protein
MKIPQDVVPIAPREGGPPQMVAVPGRARYQPPELQV